MRLGPHRVSIEHWRRVLAIRGGSQHRTVYCGGHAIYHPKKDGTRGGRFAATCGQSWNHCIRRRLTRTSFGVRGQNEARGRLCGFWQRGSLVLYFPKMQTNMPPPWLSCALTNKQDIGVPLLLSGTEVTLLCWNDLCATVRGWRHRHWHKWRVAAGLGVWTLHVHGGAQCLYFKMTRPRVCRDAKF